MEGKVLIANRGEIAIRIMNACKDLGLDYVVVYTEADRDSEHVQRNITSGSGQNAWRITNYTEPNDILAVADHTGCTAIHPGYGFFSEDFRFARRATIRDRALTFIGPNWEVIKDLGDKINTKRVANKLGIPTIPGTDAPIYNEMEAEEIAQQLLESQIDQGIANPSILIKAAAGGGGMGIEEVTRSSSSGGSTDSCKITPNASSAMAAYSSSSACGTTITSKSSCCVPATASASISAPETAPSSPPAARSGWRRRPVLTTSCFDYEFDEQKVLEQIVEYSLKLAAHVRYDNVGTWEWIVSPRRPALSAGGQHPNPGGKRRLGPDQLPRRASSPI